MLNNKKILILFTSILFLNSCGGDVGKVLRNEKIKNTDEFLVKKREPLILPPDYDKIPSPGSLRKSEKRNEVKRKRRRAIAKAKEKGKRWTIYNKQ